MRSAKAPHPSTTQSRRWFYNWLERYQSCNGQEDWFADRSRAPKTKPTKVTASIEQQVIDARKRLERQGKAQTGAIAISYELRNQGITPPEVWTINRIIARHGMPDALQMDNELAFRGSNRYPRSFGTVVRFALALGIAPVFIPVGEPWRNGIIEKFNHTYEKRFFRSQSFTDFEHLGQASNEFSLFHINHHRYSSLDHKTPDQINQELLPPMLYDGRFNVEERIPLQEGSIYFVRFVRSDCKLHLPTESFRVDQRQKYSYVVAEISVENHCLFLQQNNKVIQTLDYPMPVDW